MSAAIPSLQLPNWYRVGGEEIDGSVSAPHTYHPSSSSDWVLDASTYPLQVQTSRVHAPVHAPRPPHARANSFSHPPNLPHPPPNFSSTMSLDALLHSRPSAPSTPNTSRAAGLSSLHLNLMKEPKSARLHRQQVMQMEQVPITYHPVPSGHDLNLHLSLNPLPKSHSQSQSPVPPSPLLNGSSGYHIPGCGFHIPDYKFRFGKSFGNITGEILHDMPNGRRDNHNHQQQQSQQITQRNLPQLQLQTIPIHPPNGANGNGNSTARINSIRSRMMVQPMQINTNFDKLQY